MGSVWSLVLGAVDGAGALVASAGVGSEAARTLIAATLGGAAANTLSANATELAVAARRKRCNGGGVR